MNTVIYCRVSTDRQMTEGHGIDSQEKRCKDWCIKHDHAITKIFRDEGVSGSIGDRPAVREMLEYLTHNPHTIVVIDDIKRLARDVKVFLLLKESIQTLNCTIHYLNHSFEDSPEGNFIQTILAGAAQLERQQNARQTKQKMKARIEMGYWVFYPPLGYKFEKVNGTRQLVKTEISKYIKEAFEKYYHGTITNKYSFYQYIKDKGVKISKSPAYLMLEDVKYAGYIEYKPWEVKRIKAIHEPIISLELFEKVQEKIKLNLAPKTRTKLAEYFPLRGKIACSGCNKNLTSYVSRNRHGQEFFYYTCKTSGCNYKDKTIAKELLENSFLEVLKQARPTDDLITITTRIFNTLWVEYTQEAKKVQGGLKNEQKLMVEDIANVINKITTSKSDLVVRALELKLEELEKQRIMISYKLENINETPKDFRTPLKQVIETIKKADKLWNEGDLEVKRIIQDFAFESVLVYNLNSGFRTPVFSSLYQAFQAIGCDENTDGTQLRNYFEPFVKLIFDWGGYNLIFLGK